MPAGDHLSPEQRLDLVERYKSGEGVMRLAGEFGISRGTVHRVGRRFGVTRPIGRQMVDISAHADTIRAMYADGVSQAKIAAHLGVSQVKISRFMRSRGMHTTRGRSRSGSNHGAWKGGVVRGRDGYVWQHMSDDHPYSGMRNSTGYVAQHRLVMAEHLGRPLRKGENVHHINGVRDDNRLENLELWTKPQPYGVRAGDIRHCETCSCGN